MSSSGTGQINAGANIYQYSGSQASWNAVLDNNGNYNLVAGASSGSGAMVTIGASGNVKNGGKWNIGLHDTLIDAGSFQSGVGASFNSQGQVSVLATATWNVGPGATAKDGDSITVAPGATLDIGGTLTEGTGGFLDDLGAVTIEPAGALADDSTVTVESGASFNVLGTLTIGAGGSFNVAPGALYTVVTIDAINPVAPNPRNTPVAAVDVTFSEAVDASSFSSGAVALADNGQPVAVCGLTLLPVSGDTYAVQGLTAFTGAEGSYTVTLNAAQVRDQNGIAGSGSQSTSWVMDTTPPTSKVKLLPQRGTSLTFPVSVTGSDGGSPTSGVVSYAIYSSTNGGPWSRWTTVPASNPTASFTGQSNTTYAFYSIAHDLAGNTEVKTPKIEASTYLGNLTPPVTAVDGTTGMNPSTVNTTTGTFTLNLTGKDPGGGAATYFEVLVSIDSGAFKLAAAPIPAGPPDASGNVHATIPYQGLTDGIQHTYAFYCIGLDTAGNMQSAPGAPNLILGETFASAVPSQLKTTSFVVENGAVERSYIRYLQVGFNESDTQSGGELSQIVNSLGTASPEIQLFRYDLNDDASSKTAVSLSSANVKVLDHAIELDFGAGGLGGSPNTTTADGYYELDVKLPSGATAVHHFYRLLGDVTGDGTVDNNDLNEIAAEINLSNPGGLAPLGADVNGDGTVSALDLTLATRAKGHKVKPGLSLG